MFVLDAVRTPIGKIGGALAGVRPDDLASGVIGALVERNPTIDPGAIDDVHFGNGNGAGEENRNVARMAALLAGLPTSVPGATANRLCGSGMEAVINASREIAVGDASLAIAGGVESMTRAPWVVQKPDQPYERANQQMHSTTLGWRMVNPRHPAQWTVALGEGAEILADEFAITREMQDEFAVASHLRATEAWDAGRFDAEIVAPFGADLKRDECVRANASLESMARLKPVFRPDGQVTAGNSSPMNDGAAARVARRRAGSRSVGRRAVGASWSRARYPVSSPTATASGRSRPPSAPSIGPASRGPTWRWSNSTRHSRHRRWRVSCSGPTSTGRSSTPTVARSAIGHPIGCSGARILTTLAHELHRRGGGWGLATMCIGVGQGIAVVLKG